MSRVLALVVTLLVATALVAQDPVTVVPAASIGAFPDDGLDDGAAIQAFLDTASPGTVLKFAAGVYDCTTPSSAHVLVRNLTQVTLSGDDVGPTCLVFHDRERNGLRFEGTTDCTVEKLDLRYRDRPFTQGRILAVDPNGRFLDVSIDPGYRVPLLSDDAVLYRNANSVMVYDPWTRELSGTVDQLYVDGTTPVTPVSADVVRIHLRRSYQLAAQGVTTGKLFTLKGDLRTTLTARLTVRTTFRDVTILNSGSAAMATFLDDDLTCEGVHVLPQGDALLSSNRDGFHSKDNRGGPTVRECRFERPGDDAIAIAGTWLEITGTEKPSTIRCANPNALRFRAGDVFRLHRRADLAVVWEGTLASWSSLPPDTRSTELRFTTPVPAEAGDFVICNSLLSSGFLVHDNVTLKHRARGIHVKAPNGVIRDNHVIASRGAGILLGPELGSFFEAGFVENVAVIRNRVDRSRAMGPDAAAAAIVVTVRSALGHTIDSLARGNQDLRLCDNVVTASAGCGLLLAGVDRAVVSGNVFESCHLQEAVRESIHDFDPLTAVVHIQNCNEVRLLNNRIEGSAGHPRVHVSESSTNCGEESGSSLFHTGFEVDEGDDAWPRALAGGGRIRWLGAWEHWMEAAAIGFVDWGLSTHAPWWSPRAGHQGTATDRNGTLYVLVASARRVGFLLGAESLSGSWTLLVDAMTPDGGMTGIATLANTPTDLDATAPTPHWAWQEIETGLGPGPHVLRFRRLTTGGGEPMLYLDEIRIDR